MNFSIKGKNDFVSLTDKEWLIGFLFYFFQKTFILVNKKSKRNFTWICNKMRIIIFLLDPIQNIALKYNFRSVFLKLSPLGEADKSIYLAIII